MMTAIALYCFALWAVTLLVGCWCCGWAWHRHRRDMRNLRHMAEGQAELQREVRELRSRMAVANAALKDCRASLSECWSAGAVRASRDVH